MAKHYRYSGSKAGRLMQCPGYLQACDKLKIVYKENPHAKRGTDLHAIQEHLRKNNLTPEEINISAMFPALDANVIKEYRDVTDNVYKKLDDILDKYELDYLILEPKVTVNDETGGYIDVLAYNDEYACIIDYKMGYNPVPAEKNPQGLFYHWATLEDEKYKQYVKDKKLIFVIIQPQSEPDIWEIPPGHLKSFVKQYLDSVNWSKADNAILNAGKECKYCDNAPYCDEMKSYAKRAVKIDPQQCESLSVALTLAKILEPWIKSVYTEAESLLKTGEKLPGYKLVEKRKTKQWANVDSVIGLIDQHPLKDQFYKHDIKTPAQVLKIAAKDKELLQKLNSEIISKSSGVTLADESDKRPAIVLAEPEALKNMLKKA